MCEWVGGWVGVGGWVWVGGCGWVGGYDPTGLRAKSTCAQPNQEGILCSLVCARVPLVYDYECVIALLLYALFAL